MAASISVLFLLTLSISGITADTQTCYSKYFRPESWICDNSIDQYCCECDFNTQICCSSITNGACDIAGSLATWIWAVIGVGIAIAVIIVVCIVACCCGCCAACRSDSSTTTTVMQSPASASFGYGQMA
eukprot:m.20739 g.20739  ORF g.20739 m.20739 type:complete len:129 (+) comp28072_c0_seq1:56-442(+)